VERFHQKIFGRGVKNDSRFSGKTLGLWGSFLFQEKVRKGSSREKGFQKRQRRQQNATYEHWSEKNETRAGKSHKKGATYQGALKWQGTRASQKKGIWAVAKKGGVKPLRADRAWSWEKS